MAHYIPSGSEPDYIKALLPDVNDDPIYVGSVRVRVTLVEGPPRDFEGSQSNGIAYYFCSNKSCDSCWALQWTTQPRNRLNHLSFTREAYKKMARSGICRSCKETIKKADQERAKLYTDHMAKIEQGTLKEEEKLKRQKALVEMARANSVDKQTAYPSKAKMVDPRGNYVDVDIDPGLTQLEEELKKLAATNAAGQKRKSLSDFDIAKEKPRQGGLHDKLKAEVKRKPAAPDAFVDVPLGPPPKLDEDLLSEDPSWDVVGDDDANEGWTVINHFGSAAVEHRDAHVDCPSVRP